MATSRVKSLADLENIHLAVIGFCVLGLLVYYAVREYRRPPLPPGPKGPVPLLGMTFDLPKHHIVSTFPVLHILVGAMKKIGCLIE
jgi:hypothetical protein